MKLYVDDVRPAPEGFELARNYDEAIEFLETGEVTGLSLDHDLGEDKTGYDIACWIEERVYTDENFVPPFIVVHSANIPGARVACALKIEALIRKIYQFYVYVSD